MLLTVNTLQKTELHKAGGREQRETRTVLHKSYRKTGITYTRATGRPEINPTLHPRKPRTQFRPKWLCDGLTANPNQSYSIACDNSFQITAGDTVKAYTRTNHKRVSVRKPNRNQNCHKQRSTIHKLTKTVKSTWLQRPE